MFDPLRDIPNNSHCRWFVKRGDFITTFDRGFKSKQDASNWIYAFGTRLEWRAGYIFHLRGDTVDMEIVDRKGVRAIT